MTVYSLVLILSQFWGSQLFMSSSNCCFLTCIHVSQKGKVVWYSFLFTNFQSALIHTVKGFSMVNEAEVVILLEFTCFLYDPMNAGSLISGSSASLKPSLYIWKFLVHILLKPGLKDSEHNLTSMQNELNSMVVWTFFGNALLWDWNENWPFSSHVATAEFSKFAGILNAALSQHHLLGF